MKPFQVGDKVIYKETTPNLAYRGMIAIVIQSVPLLIKIINPDKDFHHMNPYSPSLVNIRHLSKLERQLK